MNNGCLLLHGPHFLGLNLVMNCMQSICSREWPRWSISQLKGSKLLPPPLTKNILLISDSLFFITGPSSELFFRLHPVLPLFVPNDKVLAPLLQLLMRSGTASIAGPYLHWQMSALKKSHFHLHKATLLCSPPEHISLADLASHVLSLNPDGFTTAHSYAFYKLLL